MQGRDFPESREWIDNEMVGCEFDDVRHRKRLRHLLERFSGRVGSTTHWASQDWANTKAAYRFFSNSRISEANILAGHLSSTRERFADRDATVLVLHDTPEFSYKHEHTDPIGILKKIPTGPPGLPLGLAAVKFWTRDKFHGANALKRRINPTRVPIERKESIRWLENMRHSVARQANSLCACRRSGKRHL